MSTTNSTPVVYKSAGLVGSTVVAAGAALMVSGTGANNSGGVGRELANGYGPNALRVDGFHSDLSQDGFAANGCIATTLVASMPITVDVTNPSAAQVTATSYSQAGDALTSVLNRLYVNNYGASAVTLSVGASNALTGVPTFVIPAGTSQRIDFGATGLTVSSTAKTIKLDPGTGTPSVAIGYGGN